MEIIFLKLYERMIIIYKNRKIIFLAIILFLLFTLFGCSNSNTTKQLEEKVGQQVNYLDSKLIENLNLLNKISLINYDVETKEVTLSDENNTPKSGGENSGGAGESGSNSGSESNSSSDEQKNSTITAADMKPNNILVSDRNDIEWPVIKSNIEALYVSWNAIVLDLYSANVNKDDILNFSKDFDNVIINVKNEDKPKTLLGLAKLYSYLPSFLSQINSNTEKNIKQVKSNLINAYSITEQENWKEISRQISEAETNFNNILTDTQYLSGNEYKINKAYVDLNELQTSLQNKDKDIFYIQYKTLLEDLNAM